MAPYRTEQRAGRAEAPRDPGLVDDIVAQFADPLAFYRELVQNAIDAGSPAVDVEVEHDEAAGVARATVRDRGEGMTREIVEEQLLVLFRSTKERDATKIGKFGIGFASVLAPGPRVVVVQTARAGRRLALHLHPDLTYQLFDGGPATQPGTSVQLELAMNAPRAVELAEASHAALVRWCRHAAVPIRFEARVPAAGYAREARIDRPLAIEGALVEVRGTTDEGRLTAAVGVRAAGAGPYAAFFNHGLTLHESAEPLLGALAAAVQDSRLGHTLSRDDVRRDEAFARAVAFARALATLELPTAAAAALREAAGAEDRARYHALAAALEAAGIELRAGEWALPIVEPVGGARWITAQRDAWTAPGPSAVTAALAAAGVPVVHAPADPAAWGVIARRATAYGILLSDAEAGLTRVDPVVPDARDRALLEETRALLEAAHRAPAAIELAHLAGACGDALAVAGGRADAIRARGGGDAGGSGDAGGGGSGDAGGSGGDAGGAGGGSGGDAGGAPYVLDRAAAERSPFARLRRPPLVLSAAHPAVAAARRGASLPLAASHLARAVLLHYRLLDAARSEALLARTLEHLLDPSGVA